MREICSVSDCSRLVKARGLCNLHYLRLYRTTGVNSPNRTERVLQFIEECVTSNTDKCLVPPFKSNSDYPAFVCNGVHYKVGWVVLERTKGLRPSLEQVMRHVVCGNSRCCNPRHLEWGTEKENMADKKIHGTEQDVKGEKNPNATLTDRETAEIRKRYIRGHGPYDRGNSIDLAIEYGVSRGRILQIVRGGG